MFFSLFMPNLKRIITFNSREPKMASIKLIRLFKIDNILLYINNILKTIYVLLIICYNYTNNINSLDLVIIYELIYWNIIDSNRLNSFKKNSCNINGICNTKGKIAINDFK